MLPSLSTEWNACDLFTPSVWNYNCHDRCKEEFIEEERTFHVWCHVKNCSPIHIIRLIPRGRTINNSTTMCPLEFRLRLFYSKYIEHCRQFSCVSFHLQLLFVIVLVLYSAIVRRVAYSPTIYLSPGVKLMMARNAVKLNYGSAGKRLTLLYVFLAGAKLTCEK